MSLSPHLRRATTTPLLCITPSMLDSHTANIHTSKMHLAGELLTTTSTRQLHMHTATQNITGERPTLSSNLGFSPGAPLPWPYQLVQEVLSFTSRQIVHTRVSLYAFGLVHAVSSA